MANLFQLLPIVAGQYVLPQRLDRTPEPNAVMNGASNVDDFDAIMETNISISLCGMIDLIGRLGFESKTRVAVDLACGPGHFTLMLAKHFDFDHVIGIDLSNGMLDKAKQNAKEAGLENRVSYVTGDATQLAQFDASSVDLVTCTNSAHHLPAHDLLKKMLAEMDRIVSDKGLCAVMDLTRLKTAWSVNRYVRAMGKEYIDDGLISLYEDFQNSMFAAWSPEEMLDACPTGGERQWSHFSMSPVPINQFLFSKHKQDKSLELQEFQWQDNKVPVNKIFLEDYKKFHSFKMKSLRNRTLAH